MQQTDLGLNLSTKRTRKREFLAQMERVVPWGDLVALIAPYAPEGKKGRPPFAVQTMLRIHFMQQWFTLSDPAMEEALHDVPLFREFAQLSWDQRLPDESTILRFRHLLEKHKLAEQILAVVNDLLTGKGLMLKAGTVVDAILFQLDEFGMFLSAAADRKRSPRYVCEILDLMTELYTTSGTTYFGVEYASNQFNNAHRAIHQPCACIYGTTTPLHFWQALQASNVADGSLARFLIMESEDDFPDSNQAFGMIDPPQDLIDRLILVHQGGGQSKGNLADVGGVDEVLVDPRVVAMTPSARAAFRALDQELVGKLRISRGTGFSSILARIEENATKLALIRAVSRDPVDPLIGDHDARWGILLSRHCADLTIREASARVSENQVEQQHKRALQILRDSGAAGMSRSEFTRRTQFMDHRQRDGVLRTLTEAGLIAMGPVQTGGRPSVWIRLMPP